MGSGGKIMLELQRMLYESDGKIEGLIAQCNRLEKEIYAGELLIRTLKGIIQRVRDAEKQETCDVARLPGNQRGLVQRSHSNSMGQEAVGQDEGVSQVQQAMLASQGTS